MPFGAQDFIGMAVSELVNSEKWTVFEFMAMCNVVVGTPVLVSCEIP